MSRRTFDIVNLTDDRRGWAAEFLQERWGAVRVVSRGQMHQPDQLPGFVAIMSGNPVGLLTYHMDGDGCEVVTLDSAVGGVGAGTALLEAAYEVARKAGCRRLWLITTNDNIPAIRFYQKRGFVLVALHRDALKESRRLKPEIPECGLDGIPLRDELEFEILIES